MTMSSLISGFVKPGFEAVRDAFSENFERTTCCIYHRGEKVVDLWGGIRNAATGEPWEEGAMVIVSRPGGCNRARTIGRKESRRAGAAAPGRGNDVRIGMSCPVTNRM